MSGGRGGGDEGFAVGAGGDVVHYVQEGGDAGGVAG